MSNILVHNRDIIQFDIIKSDYWDFHISTDISQIDLNDGLCEKCLSVYIDISDNECVWFDKIMSNKKYVWDHAVNNDITLNNFGFTSIDNGYTLYESDKITNQQFFDIFTKTKFNTIDNGYRLFLTKVNSNHHIYNYQNDITIEDDIQVSRLNGGWYQGFYCLNDGLDYKVLPTDLENGWNLEFVLKKEDFEHDGKILNDEYPDNKGIFFYIGTRAENKWWLKYNTDEQFEKCGNNIFENGIIENDYIKEKILNDNYFTTLIEAEENNLYCDDGYFVDNDYTLDKGKNIDEDPFCCEYIIKDDKDSCHNCNNYVDDEYYEPEAEIDEDMVIETSIGNKLNETFVKEVVTDNKFVIFDRACDGQTVHTWDKDTEFRLQLRDKPDIGNYFMLFNRACNGYDVQSIKKLFKWKEKEYNVLKDLYRNAFALQIKDNGSIGYKYLIMDCESDTENYKIETEFTKDKVIFDKKWHKINVKIVPVKFYNREHSHCIKNTLQSETMRIFIYVDGKLVLVSRLLPIFNFRTLNDHYDKQEGVPFNISIGGGTQGLCETVYLNYLKQPEYRLPLEKEFGGSFIGWFKSFKFYTCPLNYYEIVKNFNFNEIK